MPTYQYSCTECGHFFEQFQSFSEESLTVCPQCQGRLRKVFNAVGVVFKGSGFYRTDSRSTPSDKGEGAAAAGPAEKSPPSKGDGGSPASAGSSTPSATPVASGSSTSAA